MNRAVTLTHDQRRLKELADRLEARLHTTQVIAEIILENATLRECVPGPYFDGYREGALMDAVVHLSRSNFDDFCRLAELAVLPE
ncbi:hypothetical protein [Pseudomonas sp. LFM046]|uniref:hypothetical protein n=1 Tax=Pseudomonas sp. LFM046 TaxID=1608357 RepID=UPI0005CFE3DC|nr:hypothetical protein [Pseudomonas sp. LFM046]